MERRKNRTVSASAPMMSGGFDEHIEKTKKYDDGVYISATDVKDDADMSERYKEHECYPEYRVRLIRLAHEYSVMTSYSLRLFEDPYYTPSGDFPTIVVEYPSTFASSFEEVMKWGVPYVFEETTGWRGNKTTQKHKLANAYSFESLYKERNLSNVLAVLLNDIM